MQNFPEKWFIKGYITEIIEKFREISNARVQGDAEYGLYCYPKYVNNHFMFTYERYTLLENQYEEITIEQFKEHYMKKEELVLPEKWCIKGSKELHEYSLDILKNKQNVSMRTKDYFYDPSKDFIKWKWMEYVPEGYTEITFEQFKKYVLNKNNTAMSEKNIIGYELKERTQQAVSTIEFVTGGLLSGDLKNWNEDYKTNKVDLEDSIDFHATTMHKLREHNLFNLLFKPVYEEEKKKITLRCDGSSFEVIVSKEGIYYEPEKTWLPAEQIEAALDGIQVAGKYTFKPSHIDSGCKKQVPVEDWEKVINEYIKMQKS